MIRVLQNINPLFFGVLVNEEADSLAKQGTTLKQSTKYLTI